MGMSLIFYTAIILIVFILSVLGVLLVSYINRIIRKPLNSIFALFFSFIIAGIFFDFIYLKIIVNVSNYSFWLIILSLIPVVVIVIYIFYPNFEPAGFWQEILPKAMKPCRYTLASIELLFIMTLRLFAFIGITKLVFGRLFNDDISLISTLLLITTGIYAIIAQYKSIMINSFWQSLMVVLFLTLVFFVTYAGSKNFVYYLSNKPNLDILQLLSISYPSFIKIDNFSFLILMIIIGIYYWFIHRYNYQKLKYIIPNERNKYLLIPIIPLMIVIFFLIFIISSIDGRIQYLFDTSFSIVNIFMLFSNLIHVIVFLIFTLIFNVEMSVTLRSGANLLVSEIMHGVRGVYTSCREELLNQLVIIGFIFIGILFNYSNIIMNRGIIINIIKVYLYYISIVTGIYLGYFLIRRNEKIILLPSILAGFILVILMYVCDVADDSGYLLPVEPVILLLIFTILIFVLSNYIYQLLFRKNFISNSK